MNKGNKNIDRLINSKLEDFSKMPANYVWSNIASELDAKAKRRKRALAIWSSLAAAVMLAFLGGYILGEFKFKKDMADVSGIPANGFENKTLQNAAKATDKQSTKDATKATENIVGKSANQPTKTADLKPQLQNGKTLTANSSIKNTRPSVNDRNAKTIAANKTNEVSIKQSNKPKIDSKSDDITIAPSKNNIIDAKTTLSKRNKNLLPVKVHNALNTQIVPFSLHPALLNSISPLNLPAIYNTRLMFSAWFNPYYVFRNANRNESNYASIYGNNSEFTETTRFSYSAGISIGYEVINNLSVGLGVGYNTFTHAVSRNNLQTKNLQSVSPNDPQYLAIQTSAGSINQLLYYHNLYNANSFGPFINVELDNGDEIENVMQTFSYVEVPIFVKYRIGNTFGVDVTTSFNPAFLTSNKVMIDGKKRNYFYGQTQEISSFHLNAGLGIEAFVRFNRMISIYGGSSFKYSLTNWSKNPGIKMHPMYIGGRVGLMLHF